MQKLKRTLTSSSFWVICAPFLFFLWPLLQGKVIFWGLPSLQFIPWRHYAWSLLRDGIMPLWNPLNGMGAPLLANYQLALFYPPAFPLFLLDELWGAAGLAWGFTLLVPIHLAWGGLGVVRFVEQLGVGRRGQIIAGLAFAMNGYLLARGSFFSIIWAAAWLPWLLFGIEKLLASSGRSQTIKSILTLSLILSMQLFAGHAQITWYSILFSGCWLVYRAFRKNQLSHTVKYAGLFILVGLLAILLTAIQLLPTLEYLQQSQRASAYDVDTAMVYSYSPLRLLGYLAPEMFGNPGLGDFWGYASYWEDAVYIGLAPFVLALTTLSWVIRKRPNPHPKRSMLIFLWFIALVGILLSLGSSTPIFPWLFKVIPTFDMFQAPARWMIWPTIALTILAGFAADSWRGDSKKTKVAMNLAAFGGVILLVSAQATGAVMSEIEPGLVRGFTFFGIFLASAAFIARRVPTSGENSPWSAIAVGWIILDLFAAHYFLNPTIPANVFNAGNKNLANIDAVRINSRVWFDPESEYQIQYSKYFVFDDFTNVSDWADLRSSLLPDMNLLDSLPMVNNFDPLQPNRFAEWYAKVKDAPDDERYRWLSWAGVGAVIRSETDLAESLTYDPIKAKPRVVWTDCASSIDSGQDALKLVSERISDETSDPCIVIEGSALNKSSERSTGLVDIVSGNPNQLVLSSSNNSSGWILIRDTWYPGWKVKVDGIPTDLVQAEYLFRAVPVSAGKHQIELEYKPNIYYLGLTISIIAWLLFSFIWIVLHRRIPRQHQT